MFRLRHQDSTRAGVLTGRKAALIGLAAAALLVTLLLFFHTRRGERPGRDEPQKLNAEGVLLAQQGDMVRALDCFNRAIELKPDYAEAYVNRGSAHMRNGDLARAIEDYDRAIELRKDLADAYSGRGSIRRQTGDLDGAIKDLDRAIELKPDLAGAYVNRGNVYCQKGNLPRGIEDFDRALELEPELAEAYMARGNAYDNLGDAARAIGDYGRAIQVRPDYAPAYLNRAVTYAGSGAYDKALADIETCKRLGLHSLPPGMRSRFPEFEAQLRQLASELPPGAEPQADAAVAQAPIDPAAAELVAAAKEGDVQRLTEILASGVSADAVNEDGRRALNVAASAGHVEIVRKLLEAGADPNWRDGKGSTVLFFVAGGRGSPEIVRLLLEHGADPNIAGMGGVAPIHRAAIYGKMDVVRLLVEAGADPSLEVTHPQVAAADGRNAIYMALQKGHTDLAQFLADSGGALDIWTASALGRTERMAQILDGQPTLLSAQGRYGFTPLHFAAGYGQPEAAELLLKRGVAPDVREGRGRSTPLHLAVGFGHGTVAAVLLAHGADPNATDSSGKTPVQIARTSRSWRGTDGTEADRQALIQLLEKHTRQ